MHSDPRDDFGAFAGKEHMFFGLADPYAMIREETESALRRQVSDVVVERIATSGEPKFLTLGKKAENGKDLLVTAFAFAVSATIELASRSHGKERLSATVTFLFRDVDTPDGIRCRTFYDLNADAPPGFSELEPRFMAFRYE